jgi:gamma-glutamyltranspeptidase/glutathione hydrolase
MRFPLSGPSVAFSLFAVACPLWAQAPGPPLRTATRGIHGAIAAGSDYATDAGLRMYYQGGNAVDAGIAAMFAASVTEYSHFGFGGEAPILIRTPDGKVHAIAGVGTMPKLATAEFFRNRPLQPGEVQEQPQEPGLKGFIPVAGLMPALVPGMVDAALVALQQYGTKSFKQAAATAIDLADGAPIDEMRAQITESSREFFVLWPTSLQHFMPGGHTTRPGQIFRQADLAATLRKMVNAEDDALAHGANRAAGIEAVRDYFYRGAIAHKIDEFSRANKGLLRYEDFATFHLKPEDALRVEYHGYQVFKPGFWSQGPVMIETLQILSGETLTNMRPNSASYIHRVTEALKLAYADRDTYYGDPRFATIPAARLLSQAYADQRRAQISDTASLTFQPGDLGAQTRKHPSESPMTKAKIDDALMAKDTTCIDAMDQNGFMFSSTPSGAWLPSVIAGDTGIPLTERAQSFVLIEGHPNELGPGKRPRVTLSPTLVTQGGKPFAALSTPGGDNQEQSLLQVLLNVIDFHMGTEAAIEAPRFQTRHLVASFDNHAMSPGSLVLDERISPVVAQQLLARKHKVEMASRWNSGSAPVLVRLTAGGVIEAAADPYTYRSARAW